MILLEASQEEDRSKSQLLLNIHGAQNACQYVSKPRRHLHSMFLELILRAELLDFLKKQSLQTIYTGRRL